METTTATKRRGPYRKTRERKQREAAINYVVDWLERHALRKKRARAIVPFIQEGASNAGTSQQS